MTRRTLDLTCSSRRLCFASLGSSIVMVTRGHTCTLLPEALQLASIRADVQQLLVVQFKVCSLIPSLFYLPIDLLIFYVCEFKVCSWIDYVIKIVCNTTL
jgi:hypothetical protein